MLLSFLITSVNYEKLKKERNADACSAVGFANLHYLTEVTECKKPNILPVVVFGKSKATESLMDYIFTVFPKTEWHIFLPNGNPIYLYVCTHI